MKKIILLFLLLLAVSACTTDGKVDDTNKITNRNDIVSFETEETFDNPESSEHEELHEQGSLRTDIIPLCGDYVELNVPTNFRYQHVLSFEDIIVFYSENGALYAFSSKDGSQLYEINLKLSSYAFSMEKYDLKQGYNYRILFEDRVTYLDSRNVNSPLSVFLPNGLSFNRNALQSDVKSFYDMEESKFVYASKKGIVLYDSNTKEEKTIALNSSLPNLNKYHNDASIPEKYTLSYQDPQFVLGGEKILIKVFSNLDGMYVGIIIYDIYYDCIEYEYKFITSKYPGKVILDRYLIFSEWKHKELFDLENGGISFSIDDMPDGMVTADFENYYFIKYKNNGNGPIDYLGLEISHHKENTLYDNIEPFIKASNDTSEAYAKLLNDNVILIEGYDSKHKVVWICITQSGL